MATGEFLPSFWACLSCLFYLQSKKSLPKVPISESMRSRSKTVNSESCVSGNLVDASFAYVTSNPRHKPATEVPSITPITNEGEGPRDGPGSFHSASTHWGLHRYQVQGMAGEESCPGVDTRIGFEATWSWVYSFLLCHFFVV